LPRSWVPRKLAAKKRDKKKDEDGDDDGDDTNDADWQEKRIQRLLGPTAPDGG
jgi:hypothetical protein